MLDGYAEDLWCREDSGGVLEEFWIDDQDDMMLGNTVVALRYSLQGLNHSPATMKEWKAMYASTMKEWKPW